MKQFDGRIEWRDPNLLTPYSNNAKTHPRNQVDKIASSIASFGFDQPIVVDGDGVIIKGHGRREASLRLGLAKVPVLVRDDLSLSEIRAARIADNKTAESLWDEEMLRLEFGVLSEEDFDLSLTGFDLDEVAGFLDADVYEGNTPEDEVPDPPAEPTAKPGDIWQLGRHRLMCGDSTSADNVAALFDGVQPHLMVTDPPYGVKYDPEWRDGADLGVGERSRGRVQNDDRFDWREAWALFPGDVAYVWHAGVHTSGVATSLRDCGFTLRSQIIWAKQHFVLSRGDYHWQHEPCWYAVRKNKKGHWAGDRKQTTIWNIKNNNSFGNGNAEQTVGHGTQKPVECMRRPILNNSSPGQAVYDPFLGSGTTLIAAETEGRVCYGMELDPVYCDVIVKRWGDFTGEDAVLVG